MDSEKKAAFRFLKGLEYALQNLPPARQMDAWVRSQGVQAKADDNLRHLRSPEAAFLNGQVIPKLFDYVQANGLTREEARQALLSEFYRYMPTYCLQTPARTAYHPFTKLLGTNARAIYERWTNKDGKLALAQSCPDFALRSPCPHKIVFEGKYFPSGSLMHARKELTVNIYQAFFYRGLPPVASNSKGRAWHYDYGCLLAFDSSRDGTLKKAWQDMPEAVQKGFWDGANIYVMILGGQGRT